MIRVTLDGLVKRFGPTTVLDGLALDLRPGEITSVLGQPGSGKTTLASVVVGLEPLDGGEIYFDGRAVRDLPTSARRVGLVATDHGLWPHLSVLENVAYPLRVRGVGRRDQKIRAEEALGLVDQIVGLGPKPTRLPPLARFRVALARALVIDPELLILDDPTAGLRSPVRDEVLGLLRRVIPESRTTTLLLTPDPAEAMTVGTRLAILDGGRMIQEGAPTEVYGQPVDPFAARLLGPVNLLEGEVDGLDARGDAIVRTVLGRLIVRSPESGAAPEPGVTVTLAVRPEAIHLGATVLPGSNRFAATIGATTFQGPVLRVEILGPGEFPLIAFTLPSGGGNREGQSVMASVAPEHLAILPGRDLASIDRDVPKGGRP